MQQQINCESTTPWSSILRWGNWVSRWMVLEECCLLVFCAAYEYRWLSSLRYSNIVHVFPSSFPFHLSSLPPEYDGDETLFYPLTFHSAGVCCANFLFCVFHAQMLRCSFRIRRNSSSFPRHSLESNFHKKIDDESEAKVTDFQKIACVMLLHFLNSLIMAF